MPPVLTPADPAREARYSAFCGALTTRLPALEAMRLQFRNRLLLCWLLLLALAAGVAGWFWFGLGWRLDFWFAFAALLLPLWPAEIWLRWKLGENYGVRGHVELMSALVPAVNPALDYRGAPITTEELRASGLFLFDFEQSGSISLIAGSSIHGPLAGVPVRFADIEANRTYRRQRESRSVKVFKGVFCIARFPRPFVTPLIVLPDTAERLLGRLGRTLQQVPGDYGEFGPLLQFDDVEFEARFKIYARDSIAARTILHPGLRQRLLRYSRDRKLDLRMSCLNEHLQLAIAHRKPLLEMPVFRSLLSRDRFRPFWDNIATFTDIIEDLLSQ